MGGLARRGGFPSAPPAGLVAAVVIPLPRGRGFTQRA
jgi:hypothetical protein